MCKLKKRTELRMKILTLWLVIFSALALTACMHEGSGARTAQEQRNIELFDIADFEFFSKQDWPRFRT